VGNPLSVLRTSLANPSAGEYDISSNPDSIRSYELYMFMKHSIQNL
jgi:hypothetical protein